MKKYRITIQKQLWIIKCQNWAVLPLVFVSHLGPSWIVQIGWLKWLWDITITNKQAEKQMCNISAQESK